MYSFLSLATLIPSILQSYPLSLYLSHTMYFRVPCPLPERLAIEPKDDASAAEE
jgi:hypothetical protein